MGGAIRPDQFTGRGSPQSTTGLSPQPQACEFPRHSTSKLNAPRAAFLRRRLVNTAAMWIPCVHVALKANISDLLQS